MSEGEIPDGTKPGAGVTGRASAGGMFGTEASSTKIPNGTGPTQDTTTPAGPLSGSPAL